MARQRNIADDADDLIAQIEKEIAIKNKFVEELRLTIGAACTTGSELIANIHRYVGENSCELKLESKKTIRLMKKLGRPDIRPLW